MFVRSFVSGAVTLVIMTWLSWKLMLTTLGGILPVCLFAVVYARAIKNLQVKRQDKLSELGQIAEEAITNIRTVKAFSSEKGL